MRAVAQIGGAKWSLTSLVLTVGASNLVGAVIVTGYPQWGIEEAERFLGFNVIRPDDAER